ncbi:hypothetical protein COV20_00650 [Candidatus Woesearchaeota archaeon CG10_big_fil_rev_8_21_14_0_10_45_16]|nr:MAG: hypothetical protein COV20_00650 [Candidatus Woesearchaeota archaeon CG10_big_fil_rev_8_21_14_0_10_45_16]
MKPMLFYDKKQEVYFFIADEPVHCYSCRSQITANLVYQTIWRKSSEQIRTYCLRCLDRITVLGDTDEFKMCVVSSRQPSEALPVFERRPPLGGKGDCNTFNVIQIMKGSDAEVDDQTFISRDPNQSMMLDFERNILQFQKRDESLGVSAFIIQDIQKDENLSKLPVEDELQKVANKVGKKKKPVERPRVYEQSSPAIDTKQELEILDAFFKATLNSKLLLPEHEKPLLTNDSEEEM